MFCRCTSKHFLLSHTMCLITKAIIAQTQKRRNRGNKQNILTFPARKSLLEFLLRLRLLETLRTLFLRTLGLPTLGLRTVGRPEQQWAVKRRGVKCTLRVALYNRVDTVEWCSTLEKGKECPSQGITHLFWAPLLRGLIPSFIITLSFKK